jgi:hypothetical protein
MGHRTIAGLLGVGATSLVLLSGCGNGDSAAPASGGADGNVAPSGGSAGTSGTSGGSAGSSGSPASGGFAGSGGSIGPSSACGAGDPVYWVSPTGAAAWAVCKSPTPLAAAAACAIGTANTSAAAGDTVCLRGGAYAAGIAPANNGTESARIVFAGYGGEDAKFSGAITGIMLSGRAFITVESVDVDGAKVFADLIGAHHVSVLNSKLVNSSDTGGWPVGVRMYNDAHHNRLSGCTVGNSGYMTTNDDIGGVINVGNWENAADTTGYNLVENNVFFHGGHHILEVASSHNIFRNNTFHNENWTACPRGSTGNLCGDRDVGLYRDQLDANWNVFEGNRLAFAGASIDDTSGSSGLSVRSPYTIVRNNMFYFNDGVGLGLYVDSTQTYDARHSYVYHNVFYRNGVSPLSAGDLRYTFGLTFDNVAGNAAPMPITNCAVKNNLFWNNTGGDLFFYYTDHAAQAIHGNYVGVVKGSNATGMVAVTLPADNVMSSASPLFVDTSAPETVANVDTFDFHLQAASPAIDRGAFLTTTTGAGSGTVIAVADATYFIDGFGIAAGDEIQLEGQTAAARVTAVDHAANTITVDAALTWTAGLGVAMKYSGTAPDIGAFER